MLATLIDYFDLQCLLGLTFIIELELSLVFVILVQEVGALVLVSEIPGIAVR